MLTIYKLCVLIDTVVVHFFLYKYALYSIVVL